MSVLAIASMALALSAHTLGVQFRVYTVSACWHSGLRWDTPRRYLASGGIPVKIVVILTKSIVKQAKQ